MLSKKNAGRAYGVLVGFVIAISATSLFSEYLRLRLIPTVLLFIILEVACYHMGIWLMIERPEELDKKFPLSTKERRRRRQAFYDWLNSLR
jgi:hypothetical protein